MTASLKTNEMKDILLSNRIKALYNVNFSLLDGGLSKESIDNLLSKNKELDWIIYDMNSDSNLDLDVLIHSSYTYPNLKFIIISSGYVFGEFNWNESTELDEIESISNRLPDGVKLWVLRAELFDKNLLNKDFSEDRVYHGSIDKRYSLITEESLISIIDGLMKNHTEIKEGTYHIVPKDTQTEYEIFNYIVWNKGEKPYIERSTSTHPLNHILKTSKSEELDRIWKLSGYEETPTFKKLLDLIL